MMHDHRRLYLPDTNVLLTRFLSPDGGSRNFRFYEHWRLGRDHRSGLLGISGIDSDMRRLHEASPSSADARLAIQMFCYSIRKQVAAMIAALDGIDLLVFTGGIGEHDAKVRAVICDRLSWLGIRLDPARSLSVQGPISDPASRCLVRVLPSEEDAEIAAHIGELVGC
jgi:acetate kinase